MIDNTVFGLVLLGVVGVFFISCIWRMDRAGEPDGSRENAQE